MRKLIVLAVIVAVVTAACADLKDGKCGTDQDKDCAAKWVPSTDNTKCVDCTKVTEDKCGGDDKCSAGFKKSDAGDTCTANAGSGNGSGSGTGSGSGDASNSSSTENSTTTNGKVLAFAALSLVALTL